MSWPTHIVAVGGLVEDGKGNVLSVSGETTLCKESGEPVYLTKNGEEIL